MRFGSAVGALATNSFCVSVMREILEKVGDRIVVEKSPDSARRAEFLQRCRRAFPRARYLHLTRHPRSQCKSIMQFGVEREETLEAKVRTGIPIPMAQALNLYDWSTKPPVPDLQRYWFAFNTNIYEFLAGLPKDQWIRIGVRTCWRIRTSTWPPSRPGSGCGPTRRPSTP